jgi:HlyD family secretion protein
VLTLLDPPADLRPDLSATAEIIVDRRQQALAVPIVSVTLRSGEDGEEEKEGVFVVEEGVVRWRTVTLGLTGATHFEVLTGLRAGDRVVSGPFQQILTLEDGSPIRILESTVAPGAR